MQIQRRRLASILCVAMAAIGPLGLSAQGQPLVEVSILVPATTSQGMPIVAAYVIRNGSKAIVKVDVGRWARTSGLRFELTKPDGSQQIIRNPDPLITEGLTKGGRFEVAPDSVVREPFVLDEWLSFASAGNYSLRLKLEGIFVASDPTVSIRVERDAVRQVTVLPRDPEGTRRRCSQLLEILNSTRGSAAFEAAEEIAYFSDPDAIPFMLAAAEVMPNNWRVVDGFVRMGGGNGRDALVKLTLSTNAGLAAAAKQALSRIK